MKEIAKLKNNSGLLLTFPGVGNAPLLFLEWLTESKVKLESIKNDGELFIVKLGGIKETYLEAKNYINNNY